MQFLHQKLSYNYVALHPASITKFEPVIYEDLSRDKKTTPQAISCGLANF